MPRVFQIEIFLSLEIWLAQGRFPWMIQHRLEGSAVQVGGLPTARYDGEAGSWSKDITDSDTVMPLLILPGHFRVIGTWDQSPARTTKTVSIGSVPR